MKKITLLVGMVALTLIACNQYGKKQMVGKVDLFVKESITADEATKTAAFLHEIGYDTEPVAVQIDKESDTYKLRFVINKDKIKDVDLGQIFTPIKDEMAKKLFPGQKVQIDLCDDTFKTIKSL